MGTDLSWRKLLVLIDHLPPEGALNTAIRNAMPEDQLAMAAGDSARAPWSTIELLLAALLDEVRNVGWMYATSHSKSGNIRRPDPVRRPGGKHRAGRKLMRMSEVRTLDPRLKNMTDDEIRALMASPSGVRHD